MLGTLGTPEGVELHQAGPRPQSPCIREKFVRERLRKRAGLLPGATLFLHRTSFPLTVLLFSPLSEEQSLERNASISNSLKEKHPENLINAIFKTEARNQRGCDLACGGKQGRQAPISPGPDARQPLPRPGAPATHPQPHTGQALPRLRVSGGTQAGGRLRGRQAPEALGLGGNAAG